KTGEQFGVRDFNITMHSIDCIITKDNVEFFYYFLLRLFIALILLHLQVYANIQKNSHPNAMQYNLRKSSHWQPLFNSAKDIARFTSMEGNDEPNEFTSIQVI